MTTVQPRGFMDAADVVAWILRGLVMSCITAHQLHAWIEERSEASMRYDVFEYKLSQLQKMGYVEMQREVPCPQCIEYPYSHPYEWGYSLTDRGTNVERKVAARIRTGEWFIDNPEVM